MGIIIRPPIDPFKFARNGTYPDSLFQSDLAVAFNHAARYRLKEVARFGMTTGVIASPGLDDRPRWRCQYVASPHAKGVIFYGWLALTELETDELGNIIGDPYALIEVTHPIDGLAGTAELHYGASATESSIPDDCSALFSILREAGDPLANWEPEAGEIYDVLVTDVQSRIVACSIFEVHQFQGPIVDESYAAGTQILDTDRSVIVTGARDMWRTQAAPLFAWTVDDQASPRVQSGLATNNLIDNTSTAVSGATPGYTLDLRNRARVSTGTVPVRMYVYGSSTDEGSVCLKDSSGTIVGNVAIDNATPQWFEADFELPATLAKYDVQYAGPFGETTEVYAVQLIQHLDE